ncbi:MAG: 2-polyprenyl-6-methoxyphenol hydroxylase-like oxidoreductase [Actinophytocola sp.]|nr:2-polyprenyl-6-methoxyphenol hydroxylase-like oxidoreductase [Actinophytocola sp.]
MTRTTNRIGEHAIVLGAGMGGLLAARVLADAYHRVTVIERDQLSESADNRRGVPQGRHVHALLPRGAEIMDELFPGILDELVAAGAPVIADFTKLRFLPDGLHRLSTRMKAPPVYQPSRPLLEASIRQRVRALPNVRVLDGHDVIGLTTDDARGRITSVQFQRRDDGDGAHAFSADLVVDAMGRGARASAWLTELGYDAPAEDEVVVNIRYVSRLLRLRPGAVPETLIVHGPEADSPYGYGLFAYENDTWLLTVQQFDGDRGVPDYEWMLDRVADKAPGHVVAALADAEPLADVVMHRFPANRRRRYDRLTRFPEGLLVFGDALCSFNPIYGQGMSVAAMEALALRKVLRRGSNRLAWRFFAKAAEVIDVAWQLAVGADLALPFIKGPRPLPVRLVNAYVAKVLTAAEHDPVVATQFLRVSAFLDKPPALMRPSIVARVITATQRARRVPAPVTPVAAPGRSAKLG